MKNKSLKINLLIICNIFFVIKTENKEINYQNNPYYQNVLNSFEGHEVFKNKDEYITNEHGYVRPYELIKYNQNNEIKDWLNKWEDKYNNFKELNNSTKELAKFFNSLKIPKHQTDIFRYPNNVDMKFFKRLHLPFFDGFYKDVPILNMNEVEINSDNLLNSIKENNNYNGFLKDLNSKEKIIFKFSDPNYKKAYKEYSVINDKIIEYIDKKNKDYSSNLDSFLKIKKGLNDKKQYLESKYNKNINATQDLSSLLNENTETTKHKLNIVNYKIDEINKNIQSEYPEYKEENIN